jgi:hypothetical protein
MMHLPRRVAAARPAALRATLTAVAVALTVSALGTAVFTVSLGESVADGLLNFLTFGGLAALTAGVLSWELASSRVCPRCRREGPRGAAGCANCGYDLRTRRRFACSEGHVVAYEPGLCDCGRRLLELGPVPVLRHAMRTLLLAFAVVAALGIAALLAAALQ